MFEQMLLLKTDNKFHGGFFWFVCLLLCYRCLFYALQIVGAQVFEEDRKKNRKEGRISTGKIF